jgi:lysophospholipase L1-like esterase
VKRTLNALIAAGLACTALAGTACAATTTVSPWRPGVGGGPGDTRVHSVAQWKEMVRAQTRDLRENVNARQLFVGDSITARWLNVGERAWDENFASSTNNAGIGGDTTSMVLWRLYHTEFDGLGLSSIVLLIGTNDLNYGFTPAEVEKGIIRTTRAFQREFPRASVFVVSLLPKYDATNPEHAMIPQVNALLAQQVPGLAAVYGIHAVYIDAYKHFVDSEGNQLPGYFDAGGVHPTARGYDELATVLDASIPA